MKKKIIKAWLRIYNENTRPSVLWEKPTKKDIEVDKKFDVKVVKCTITIP